MKKLKSPNIRYNVKTLKSGQIQVIAICITNKECIAYWMSAFMAERACPRG